MHRCTASAAGGISQRLKPGRATMRSRARKLGTATDDLRGTGRRVRADATDELYGCCEPARSWETYGSGAGSVRRAPDRVTCRDQIVVPRTVHGPPGGLGPGVPRVAACRTR